VIALGDPNPSRAVVLLHGRGSSPEDILGLVQHLPQAGTRFLAPRAVGGAWYPQRFLRPIAENEPFLSTALGQVQQAVLEMGLPHEKIVLLGFSQGACLALEFAARHGGRFGGVVGLSGGLIGTDAELGALAHPLESTPVFLGCDANDFHIPLERVDSSAAILERLGAVVDKRIYRGLGHGINQDEINAVQQMLNSL
jgi:predicted esterase